MGWLRHTDCLLVVYVYSDTWLVCYCLRGLHLPHVGVLVLGSVACWVTDWAYLHAFTVSCLTFDGPIPAVYTRHIAVDR